MTTIITGSYIETKNDNGSSVLELTPNLGKTQPVGVWPGINPTLTKYDAPFNGPPGAFFKFLAAGSGWMQPGTAFYYHGTAVIGARISVPQNGTWKITLKAWAGATPPNNTWAGQLSLAVDQIFAQIDPALGSGFVYNVSNVGQPSQTDYVWFVPILAGEHQIQIRGYAGGVSIGVENFKIELFEAGLPLEPAGSRDPTLQPMSSHHIINTSIGSGAIWSGVNDPDTVLLRTGYGTINGPQWSIPVYKGAASDPVKIWRCIDEGYVPHGDVSMNMPAGMVVSPPADAGGDHAIALFGTDRRWMFSGFNATVNHSSGCGVYLGRDQITDMFNGFNHAIGQGSGQIPGLIRGWEVLAGDIKHMLVMGLSASMLRPVPTPWTGLGWPNWEADYNGAFGQYTGAANAIQYGVTVGIPSTVDLTTLGLSGPGLILARCLQDYGAIHAIQAGAPNPNVTLYAEQDVSTFNPQLVAMDADFRTKLTPLLRIMRNQGPLTINGGGTRRRPMLPGIAF